MTLSSRDELVRALPYARRYARALVADQAAGDQLVTAALRALMAEGGGSGDPRLALYRLVTREAAAARPGHPAAGADDAVDAGGLTGVQRRLLLLTALEELGTNAAADVVGLPHEAAHAQLAEARKRLRAASATDVLIIEDEPIIAMDIEELVQNCGHRVVGVASTEREAVELARRTRPGLILADINLGSGGDGMMAVSRIVDSHPAPVIFVTAYPERLLTGDQVEPTFVITKPFEPMTLAVATYQAVTGGVRLD